MSKKGRVLVAMSGGVDSSTAAVLLSEQGWEVIGLTMKTWDYDTAGGADPDKEVGCCSLESMNDARGVANKYGFTHFVVDIRDEFGDWVIERFTEEYLAGRTPNPCVLCNTHIKWDALLRRADQLGCDKIATGHYARLTRSEQTGRYTVRRGVDPQKDQSYALWGLPQDQLARSLFPLGEYEKPEIREMAADFGLHRVADKPDSYEICFIPDNNYRRFLKDRVDGLEEKVAGGDFVLKDGTVVGEHEGYPFYTVGQRRGLGLDEVLPGERVYVTDIDAETNTITVGPREELMQQRLLARQINLMKYDTLEEERPATGMIRYNDKPGAPCLVRQTGDDTLEVHFAEERRAITAGQSIVLYEGDEVLAGGWIHEVGAADTLEEAAPAASGEQLARVAS